MMDGDVVRVPDGEASRRVAVNRRTGEVVHPTPGVRIGLWEAELYVKTDEYRERAERHCG